MIDGTATPTPAEWPALRAAWAQGTISAADMAEGWENPYMLLTRMVRRGLLRRLRPGTYAATHSRETTISYVLGEE